MSESDKKHKHSVFVSFSHENRAIAQRLIRELQAQGIDARSGDEVLAGENYSVDGLVKSADGVIFLIEAKNDPSSAQGREWSAALEAKWKDPDKRFVPVLLGKAEVPSFLAGYGALRLKRPRKELSSAVNKLIDLINRESSRTAVISSNDKSAVKRSKRLEYIEKAAETLRD